MNSYAVYPAFRSRWAHEVRCGGRTYARCDNAKDAANIARAMNMAIAVSRAAALEVKPDKPL
jgi:hypothetical protein